MEPEQYCLKWNNFQSNLSNAFGSLLGTEDLADVTLTCEGISIKAHKLVLSLCSPYFRNVFKNNPCSHPIVILKDVLHVDLVAVLNFMYHGEVLISQDKIASFLQTAEALQVSGLVGNMGLTEIPIQLTNSIKSSLKTTRITENISKKSKVKSKPVSTVAKLAEPLPRTKDSTSRSPPQELFESIPIDNIKTENTEETQGDHNCNDKIDLYESCERNKLQSSILEAALELKETSSSILERSLMSQPSKSPCILTYTLDNVPSTLPSSPEAIEPIKSDEMERRSLKHKLSEVGLQQSKTFDLTLDHSQIKHFKYDDTLKNVEVNIKGLPSDISVVNVRAMPDMQPHHSSQCGNCPHCGKVYSNQSALKYHVRLVHSDLTNMYCCHLCPESFDYREGYKKHMVEAHSIRN